MARKTDQEPFLLARGGPFFDLQKEAGLVQAERLNSFRRAAFFVGVTWLVPLMICVMAGTAFGPLTARPYLLDPGVWARSFLAIGLFVLAEAQIEKGLHDGVVHFFGSGLLPLSSLSGAKSAVARALRRRDNALAEAVFALLAIGASVFLLWNMRDQTVASWAVKSGPDGVSYTAAAWWSIVVSNTLFWFLLMRAVWRHIIWSMLLKTFSQLETRLVATHPDGHAGLAFVGRYPNVYVLFTIAVSCVVAAAVTHQVLHGTLTASTFGIVAGLWLVVITAYFGLPLLSFVRPLLDLKGKTVHAASQRATDYQRQVEHKTLGGNIAVPSDETGSTDLPDPGKLYDSAKKLSPVLITKSAMIPVFLSALLPFVAVGLTQLPVKELLPVLKRLLLL